MSSHLRYSDYAHERPPFLARANHTQLDCIHLAPGLARRGCTLSCRLCLAFITDSGPPFISAQGSRLALNIRAELAAARGLARAGPGIALSDISSLHLSQVQTAPGPPTARIAGGSCGMVIPRTCPLDRAPSSIYNLQEMPCRLGAADRPSGESGAGGKAPLCVLQAPEDISATVPRYLVEGFSGAAASCSTEPGHLFSMGMGTAVTARRVGVGTNRLSYLLVDQQCRRAMHIGETIDECF